MFFRSAFVGNILGMRFTMHRIAIIGAMLSVLGKSIAVVAPNMLVLIVGLGIVSGQYLFHLTSLSNCKYTMDHLIASDYASAW